MKYKVGDRVKIKSLDWYNKNKGNANRTDSVWCKDGKVWFIYHMSQYCGKIMTIINVWENFYTLEGSGNRWTDEMIEGLAEEKIGLVDIFSSRCVNEFNLPDGYIFKDEKGNIINTNKIVLEKKGYPKTYEECTKVLLDRASVRNDLGYIADLLVDLQKLLVCRNAYWKIAGEEMGLGKPWEPDWKSIDQEKYCIHTNSNNIKKGVWFFTNAIIAFPTEEMRDAFYDNFKELIENCKELL